MSRLTSILAFGMLIGLSWAAPVARGAPLGRTIQGRVFDRDRNLLRGAAILVRPDDPTSPSQFEENASAVSNATGHYRLDLSQFPWAAGGLSLLILAEGQAPVTRAIAPGVATDSVDFILSPEAWKSTLVEVITPTGEPLSGAKVDVRVGKYAWSHHRTDNTGRFQYSMSGAQTHILDIAAEGFRPTRVARGFQAGEPTSLTIKLSRPIRGVVVDPCGKPRQSIVIGKRLSFYGEEPRIVPFTDDGKDFKETTDAGGRFRLSLPMLLDGSGQILRPVEVLCFGDEELNQIAFHVHDVYNAQPYAAIQLYPARQVTIPLRSLKEYTRSDAPPEFFLYPNPRSHRTVLFAAGQVVPEGSPSRGDIRWQFRARLPAGRYVLSMDNHELSLEHSLVVPEGDGPVVLPVTELRPFPYSLMVGRPAREIDAVALDSGKPVHLVDYRGKVVVLDFWGYWCGPCVLELKKLAELHHRFQEEPVVILALHDASVRSRAEYDRRISTALG